MKGMMRVRKGDLVRIMSGKDKGKSGKVFRMDSKKGLVLIEGLNLKKKHVRPREQGKKGEIVQLPAFFPASKVMIVCGSCNKPTRIGVQIESAKKIRICKKCKAAI